MHGGERPVREHDLSADVFPLVTLRVRAGARVHELRRHVGVLAVVGEGHRRRRERFDRARARRDFLERGRDGVPPEVAEESARSESSRLPGGARRRHPRARPRGASFACARPRRRTRAIRARDGNARAPGRSRAPRSRRSAPGLRRAPRRARTECVGPRRGPERRRTPGPGTRALSSLFLRARQAYRFSPLSGATEETYASIDDFCSGVSFALAAILSRIDGHFRGSIFEGWRSRWHPPHFAAYRARPGSKEGSGAGSSVVAHATSAHRAPASRSTGIPAFLLSVIRSKTTGSRGHRSFRRGESIPSTARTRPTPSRPGTKPPARSSPSTP